MLNGGVFEENPPRDEMIGGVTIEEITDVTDSRVLAVDGLCVEITGAVVAREITWDEIIDCSTVERVAESVAEDSGELICEPVAKFDGSEAGFAAVVPPDKLGGSGAIRDTCGEWVVDIVGVGPPPDESGGNVPGSEANLEDMDDIPEDKIRLGERPRVVEEG